MSSTITINIAGDSRGFQRTAKSVIGQTSKLGDSFRRVGTIATGVLTAQVIRRGFDFLTDQIGSVIDEARESQRVGRQTAAVLKSTGNAAHVSAQGVGDLATRLSNLNGVDDETIQGAENLLLTFTNVRNEVGKGNDVFNQASSAIVDMTAAMNNGQVTAEGLRSSTIQVGKALQDPVKGATALRRVGVALTQQQQDQIKAFVASGKTLDAQKIILRELSKEFGGAAAAAADPMQRLGVTIANLKEQIGLALLPILDKAATFLANTFVPALQKAGKAVREGFGGQALFQEADGIIGVFQRVGEAIRGIVEFFKGDTFGAGANLGAALGIDPKNIAAVIRSVDRVHQAFQSVVDFIKAHLKPILIGVGVAFLAITSPITAVVAGIAFLLVKFRGLREGVFGAAKGIVEFGRSLAGPTRDLIVGVGKGLADFGKALFEFARRALPPVIAGFALFVKVALPVAAKVLPPMVRSLAAILRALRPLAPAVGVAVGAFVTFKAATKTFDVVKTGVTSTIAIVSKIGPAFEGAASAASTALVALRSALTAFTAFAAANPIVLIVAAIVGLGVAVYVAYQKFKPFRDAVDAVGRALKDAFEWVVDHWKLLGIILVAPIAAPVAAFLAFRDQIIGFFKGVVDWLTDHWKVILLVLLAPIAPAVAAFLAFRDKIGEIVSAVVGFFLKLPGRILGAIGGLALQLAAKGIEAVRGMLRGIIGEAQNLYGYVASIPGKILGFLRNAGNWLYDIGKQLIGGLIHGITDKLGDLKDSLGGIASKVVSWKGPPAKDSVLLFDNGRRTMRGYIKGLTAELPSLHRTLGGVTGGIGTPKLAPGAGVAGRTIHIANLNVYGTDPKTASKAFFTELRRQEQLAG